MQNKSLQMTTEEIDQFKQQIAINKQFEQWLQGKDKEKEACVKAESDKNENMTKPKH